MHSNAHRSNRLYPYHNANLNLRFVSLSESPSSGTARSRLRAARSGNRQSGAAPPPKYNTTERPTVSVGLRRRRRVSLECEVGNDSFFWKLFGKTLLKGGRRQIECIGQPSCQNGVLYSNAMTRAFLNDPRGGPASSGKGLLAGFQPLAGWTPPPPGGWGGVRLKKGPAHDPLPLTFTDSVFACGHSLAVWVTRCWAFRSVIKSGVRKAGRSVSREVGL